MKIRESDTANKPAPELETLLTPEDQKDIFKVGLAKLRMWRQEYGMSFFRVKRSLRFLPSAVKQWFHTHHGPQSAGKQSKAGA